MADTPDYGRYTLLELLDARRSIDESAWPERVKDLDRRIALRQAEQEPASNSPPESIFYKISRRAIGLYLFLSGSSSAVLLVEHIVRLPDRLARAVLPAVLYAAMAAGGVLLMRRKRVGLLMSVIVMALQLPVIQVGRLTYAVMSVPSFQLQLWPLVGFSFNTMNSWSIMWHPTEQPLYLALNVWAGVAVMLLGTQYDRVQDARRRLFRRRGRRLPPSN